MAPITHCLMTYTVYWLSDKNFTRTDHSAFEYLQSMM